LALRPRPGRSPSSIRRGKKPHKRRSRKRSGRPTPLRIEENSIPPAIERAAEARDYQRGVKPTEETTVILQAAPLPSDAGKAREKARAWVEPATAASQKRCVTQNVVGGIEGQQQVQGNTVIQSTSSGVIAICK
jgi:hypothetical protein